ncbi:hypothetical protein LINGRAHAP2_LOCUS5008 [Linum grandiflorum]
MWLLRLPLQLPLQDHSLHRGRNRHSHPRILASGSTQQDQGQPNRGHLNPVQPFHIRQPPPLQPCAKRHCSEPQQAHRHLLRLHRSSWVLLRSAVRVHNPWSFLPGSQEH